MSKSKKTSKASKKEKDAKTRLMDLLAGWSLFLDGSEERKAPWAEPKTWERVHDMYQDVGGREKMTREEVHKYVVVTLAKVVLDGVE